MTGCPVRLSVRDRWESSARHPGHEPTDLGHVFRHVQGDDVECGDRYIVLDRPSLTGCSNKNEPMSKERYTPPNTTAALR